MKATDLRIGNIVEYYIEDSQTWERNIIDAQDLMVFEEKPDSFLKHHRPILLSSERLSKMKAQNGDILFDGNDFIRINESLDFSVELLSGEYLPNIYYASYDSDYNFLSPIKYLHELQNIVFALTGKEMEVVYE